jgi:hypothetical protein
MSQMDGTFLTNKQQAASAFHFSIASEYLRDMKTVHPAKGQQMHSVAMHAGC